MTAPNSDTVSALVAECVAVDGLSPFNDQALLEAARGDRRIVQRDAALAIVSSQPVPEVEFAVSPNARRAGSGRALAELLAREFPGFEVWAHGDLPGAQAIARHLKLQRIRTLLQLRAPVPPAARDARVRSFTAEDTAAWLALNAASFSEHPEQGSLTLTDFEDRRASSWHDDENLMIVDGDDGLAGYAWVKPESDFCELYALGVSPSAQGTGLGRVLLDATFARMRDLGFETAHLYVEGDNEPALGLYRSHGFTDYRVDVRYRHHV